ncbi:MAG: DUF1499 domain-containing protein [Spirochaetes bacterium]|nr:MAG: DUF1499 domain-containing protein [Spirochaetota bacterium]
MFGCSGTPPHNLGVHDGRLSPCPDKPNCVSTISEDPRHRMKPISYDGELKAAREKLIGVIGSMKRTRIVTAEDAYLHVEFTSALFRFVDDVEFLFDDARKIIHFRSASRLGNGDMGVNRKRMKEVRTRFGEQAPIRLPE